MGRIGKNIKSYIQKLSGSDNNAQHSSVEEFSGDDRTTQNFGPCNEDFAPPENVEHFNQQIGKDRGQLYSTAYRNQSIEPQAVFGEFRKFSTNQAGDTVMAEIFCKQDGTILIKNESTEIILKPGGTGDYEFTCSGNLIGSAATMQLNGNTYNLVMWQALNTALQGLVTALQNHTHGGGSGVDQTFTLDITSARADTLKTDG